MNLLSTREWKLFAASAAVKLLFVLIVLWQGGLFQPFETVQSDGYLPLAVNLYEHHAFTYSTTTPFVPEALQVPGYPLFLAILAAPFGTIALALALQVVLMSLSVIFFYRLTEGMFSERVRLYAALAYGIEPFASFMAASALTEALFMFLFIGGLYALRLGIVDGKARWWILTGLSLGASIVVRPIGLYIVPLLVIGALVLVWRARGTLAWSTIALALLATALLPGVWVARNYANFGVPTLATKGPFTLYFYNVEQLLEYRDHRSAQEVSEQLLAQAQQDNPTVKARDDLRDPKYAPYLNTKSLEYIRANLPLYIKLQMLSTATFFVSDGYRLLAQSLAVGLAPLPNITKAIASGHISTLVGYFRSSPVSLGLFVVGTLLWVAVTLCALGALFLTLRRGSLCTRAAVWVCAVLIAYFAVLTGPVAQARYRVVVEPYLFILAAYTIAELYSWYKRRVW